MKKTLLTTLLIVNIAITTYSQTPFGPEQNIDTNTGNRPFTIASGDLDGDTFIDIVIGTFDNFDSTGDDINWYKNDGSGNFTLQTIVTASFDFVGGLAIADLDGMNGNDIIAASSSGDKVVWFANDGSGGFGSEQLIASLDGAGQIVIVDINNDTNIDIVVVGFDANKVVWYAGDGTGNFGAEQIIESGTIGPGAINFADFDNDNDLDVVIGYSSSPGDIEVFYNQFIESGTSTVSWIIDIHQVDSGNDFLFVVQFADVNDDGNLDIIKSDFGINDANPGEVAWFNKETDGTYTKTIIASSINNPAIVLVSKINSDNFTDIVISNGNIPGDEIIWFESTGAGTYFPEAVISDAQQQVFGVTANDFNGDTKPDIASVDFQGFDLNWFENNFVLGLNNNSIQKISIYPNPTADKLFFKGSFNNNFKVSVFDILGKKILAKTLNTNESLDVSRLNTGIYIIRFDEFNTTYKFVKE